MNLDNITKEWEEIKIILKNKFENVDFYNDYFSKIKILNRIEKKIYFLCPNLFCKNFVINNFKVDIEQKFLDITNIKYNCVFLDKSDDLINLDVGGKNYNDGLDVRKTFKSYVFGNFNKEIFDISEKILSDNFNYSPVFIFGTTGVGKTHALNSIGNNFKSQFPNKKILFIDTEDFLTQTYKAISSGTDSVEKFKEKFLDLDLLIVDDIQFLSNKNKLNEIFLYIFNYLIKKSKNIVIASDKLPSDLKIDERMMSRFRSGININIKAPDDNSIEKIIINYSKKYNFSFLDDGVVFLRNRFKGDIRILIGVMNKITMYIGVNDLKTPLNKEIIEKILENEFKNGLINTGYNVSPIVIIETVAGIYGIGKDLIISKSRKKDISNARKICIYIIRKKINLSYAEIGVILSNRSHSTILEAFKVLENEIEKNSDFKGFIENIIKKI